MTHYLSPWRDPVLTQRLRWERVLCHWHYLLVRLLIMPAITTTSSLFARKRSVKEVLIKSGLSPFSQFYMASSTVLSQGSATQGNLLGVDKAAETRPRRADCSGWGSWRGQEGTRQRSGQTRIPLYPEVSWTKRGDHRFLFHTNQNPFVSGCWLEL